MSIKINFDTANNPESPTIILAKKNGDKLGKIDAYEIELNDNLNDASEMSFRVNKYVDGKNSNLWDEIRNFRLAYCVEWDKWFEITVEIDESNETVKTVSATNLGHAELSQIMLYDVQINTEDDIKRKISVYNKGEADNVIPAVLYRDIDSVPEEDREEYRDGSILHRILEKAPHYSVEHVDSTIKDKQRTFEFSDTSIYDACQEIAEEINCIFVFDSNSDENGSIRRTISVYDLESNCNDCGYRGEFFDQCPKCGSTDVLNGYGEDTNIFVTSDELADDIQLSTDIEQIKNCFKLEAGDDDVTAAIRNCNPNGTDYIWYFTDEMKEDMSDELVAKIDKYNEKYAEYQTKKIELDEALLDQYNALVDKYKSFNEDLEIIEKPVNGFPDLIDAYYNTFDLYLYLKSGLMPSIDTARPSLEDEIAKLIIENISPVAVNVTSDSSNNPLKTASVYTVDSIVLSMAKTLIDSRYKIKVADGSTLTDYVEGEATRTWKGKFILTAYSDDEVTATTEQIEVVVNDEYETFVRRKIDTALSNADAEDMSISGLFKKNLIKDLEEGESENDSFEYAIKEYSLNMLSSFYDACQTCIDIMVEQGVADGKTWGNVEGDANLYDNLYMPYYNKLAAIANEMSVRENEINIIIGKYDEDGDLKTQGLQNAIEKIKSDIQDELNFEDFLGEELWLEFCSFRREDKYSNDNYTSEGLNNAEMIEKAKEFIEVAQKEIYKSAELQCSISANLKNLLVIDKFKSLIDDFRVGNWIRVMIDDVVYKLRLINYTIDYENLDEISVEFSDVINANSSIKSVQEVLDQASSMATSYSTVKRQAKQGEESKSTINNWFGNGLDATNVKIVGGAEGQSQSWDDHGMLFREYDSNTGDYSPEQLKIINSTMAITNDNWKTTKTAVGKYYYTDPNTNESKMAYGVNAETIIGQLILGESLLFSNKTGTLSFDGNGLTAKDSSDTRKVIIDPSDESSVFKIQTITDEETDYSNKFFVDEDGNLTLVGNITANKLNIAEAVSGGEVTGFSDVAISGKYTDLIGDSSKSGHVLQLDGNGGVSVSSAPLKKVATSGSYIDLSDTPNLSTVATSGSYIDLSDTPNLSTVATSGSYTDLTGSTLDAGKLLYVGTDGKITSITIDELKVKLGIS